MSRELEEWEAEADLFHRETGYMRPGKDARYGQDREHREIAFAVWYKKQQELVAVRERAAALAGLLREYCSNAAPGLQERIDAALGGVS